jgi:hypothetical protein
VLSTLYVVGNAAVSVIEACGDDRAQIPNTADVCDHKGATGLSGGDDSEVVFVLPLRSSF